MGVGFGRRSAVGGPLFYGTSVAGERHPICCKASMIAWLHIGVSKLANSAPFLAGLFVLMCLRGYSVSLAAVLTRRSCGVAAWTRLGEAETTVTRTQSEFGLAPAVLDAAGVFLS